MNEKADTVRFTDGHSPPVDIPVRELAPGTLFARRLGDAEAAYIPADAISDEPRVVWPPLPAGVCAHTIADYRRLLPHVAPHGPETVWVDGFRNDCHPWYEIALWSVAAGVYKKAVKLGRLKGAARRDAYRVVSAAMVAEKPHHVLHLLPKLGISNGRALSIAEGYRQSIRSDGFNRLVAWLYLSIVPDRSVPIRMNPEQMAAFFASGGRAK